MSVRSQLRSGELAKDFMKTVFGIKLCVYAPEYSLTSGANPCDDRAL